MIYPRVTNKLISENVVDILNTNRSKLNQLNEQIATGKKISKASDNPTGAVSILTTNTSMNKIESYKKNIDSASSEMDATDRATLSLIDSIHRARDLTLQAADASSGPSELASINDEIKQLTEQVKDIANTQFGNKYIFGGLVTSSAPFLKAGDNGDEVKYVGTDSTQNYQRQVEIGENIKVDLNVAGDNIFGQYYTDKTTDPATTVSSGIIGTLKELSKELETTPANYDNIRSKLNGLDASLSKTLNVQATVGGMMSRLDMTKNKLEEDNVTLTKFKSNIEDLDLPKAISDLKFQQDSLQASLSISAKVMQASLLQYL
ncbi:MAG: flagellar hook-associated protein FlgL [bacterium]